MTMERFELPAIGAPGPITFPPIERTTLDNGLRLWSIAHTSVPVVTAQLVIRRGAADASFNAVTVDANGDVYVNTGSSIALFDSSLNLLRVFAQKELGGSRGVAGGARDCSSRRPFRDGPSR